MGNALVWLVWIVAAAACVGSGALVISFQNPFFSALALIGNLASLAVLYLLLAEPIKRVPVADRELYDTPIPYYKSAS